MRTTNRRRLATVTATALAVLLAVPALGGASEPGTDTTPPAGDEQAGDEQAGDEQVGVDEGGQGAEDDTLITPEPAYEENPDGQGDGDTAGDGDDARSDDHTRETVPPCAPLVTFTATQTTGDDRAVAITAQALERDVEGWSMVAWEAAATTTLTTVVVEHRDGRVETLTDDIGRGTAHGVVRLSFCGSVGTATTEGGDGADGDGTEPPSGTGDEVRGGSSTSDVPARANDTGTTGDDGAEEAEESDGDADDTADETGDAAADVAGIAAGTAGDGDVEVLGVQLARTGGDVGALATGGTVGLVAGLLALAAARRVAREDRA